MNTPDPKKFDFGRLVSTVANLGVLVGLLLVSMQISQSTDIARAQLANDYYLADMQLELSMMGESPVDSWTRAVHTPDDITPHDAAVLDRFFNYGLVQVRRLQQMQQLGLAAAVMAALWAVGVLSGRDAAATARTGRPLPAAAAAGPGGDRPPA